jgi:hypothetical protein
VDDDSDGIRNPALCGKGYRMSRTESAERVDTGQTLTVEQWLDMLPPQAMPAQERVLSVLKYARPLKIRPDVWRHHFKGYAGWAVKPGRALQIVPADGGKRAATLPDWAVEQLGVGRGDLVCITQKSVEQGGHLYLKRIVAQRVDSAIPGLIAYDQYGDTTVIRRWSCTGGPRDVTCDHARGIVEQVGRLRCDPVAPLCALQGRTGYLARKNLLGLSTESDLQFARSYKQSIAGKQLEDGSWDGNALESAYNVMDLLEMGARPEDDAVRRCTDWLLALPDPTGAPGTFNVSREVTEMFNRFRDENPNGRVSAYDRVAKDRHRRSEFLPHLAHGDVFGVPSEFCDARHLFVTGVVLQALLQCGLEREHRVNLALRTLLGRPWCQEYYHGNADQALSTDPVDLNAPACEDYLRSGFEGWDLDEAGVLGLMSSTGLRGGRTYVSRGAGCGCPTMISRALSYHSQWPASLLQRRTADGFVGSLGWDWSQVHTYPSFLFSYLARLGTPVAAYGAARYVPMLKGTQQPDGLWDESERLAPVGGRRKHVKFAKGGVVPPLKREQSAYLICASLESLGLLELLRPLDA